MNTKPYNKPKFGTTHNPPLGVGKVGTKSRQLPKPPMERKRKKEKCYTLPQSQYENESEFHNLRIVTNEEQSSLSKPNMVVGTSCRGGQPLGLGCPNTSVTFFGIRSWPLGESQSKLGQPRDTTFTRVPWRVSSVKLTRYSQVLSWLGYRPRPLLIALDPLLVIRLGGFHCLLFLPLRRGHFSFNALGPWLGHLKVGLVRRLNPKP